MDERRRHSGGHSELNFGHDAPCFAQHFQNALVVAHVVKAQHPAFSVFEPFLRRLVAADVKVLGTIGHGVEMLGGVDPDLARIATRPLHIAAALTPDLRAMKWLMRLGLSLAIGAGLLTGRNRMRFSETPRFCGR